MDNGCDVLLVDDSADARVFLSRELAAAGLQVHAVDSGAAALAYLEAYLPGAILLDVLMPEMDGFETCRRIRARSDEVPVIFMTGLGEADHIVQGFEVGGNDYVIKPVSPPVVIARIQAHTRTARLVRATREAVNATEMAMLALDADGSMLWCNAAARQLFATRAAPGAGVDELPVPASFAALVQSGAPAEHEYLLRLDAGELRARRVSEADQPVRVFALRPGNAAAPAWTPPQLTAREGEVLLWVARGKTNRDIADILGMSPRTVNKHLEHIFEKLGVETRSAAAAAAHRLKLTDTP